MCHILNFVFVIQFCSIFTFTKLQFSPVNSLPNEKILELYNLKVFADDKINIHVYQILKFV